MDSTQTKRFSGKVALVTGGARGIGAAIATKLAAEGADVAITYSTSVDAANALVDRLKSFGVQAVAIKADAARPGEAAEAVKTVVRRFNKLDILVNNAGVAIFKPVGEVEESDYNQTFDINVRAVFAAVQEAAKHMGDGGRSITIGSVNGDRMPMAGGALYAASKFAVQGFTRGWSRELAHKGITVNVVQPGPIDTDMNPASGPFAGMLTPMTALGRYGKPEEVANLVAFVASAEASYITGTALNVDGGFEA